MFRIGPSALVILVASGCSSAHSIANDDAGSDTTHAMPEPSQVELTWFGEDFEDMEVCIHDVCALVGETLLVEPPIRGDRVRVEYRMNGVRLELELEWSWDLEWHGIAVDDAVTRRMSIGLFRRADGACVPYRTSHVVNGVATTWLPPAADEMILCGPFE